MDKERIELARTRYSLRDIVSADVVLRRHSGGWMGKCPFHNEKTPSFHVSDTRGTFKCFGCGAWGDIFDYVMLRNGLSFAESVTRLLGSSETVHTAAAFRKRQPDRESEAEDEKRRMAHAHAVWLKRRPIEGTLAEIYLRCRGITLPLPDALGHVDEAWCSDIKDKSQALVAPILSSAGHVTAIQQIFLSSETQDAWRDARGRRSKRTLGPMHDGCVRLGMPASTLGLAGSVEDALSAMQIFSIPVWATCGEGRLSRVWVPPDIETLVIFADADEPGEREARKCIRAPQFSHCRVELAPPERGKDWTDMLRDAA